MSWNFNSSSPIYLQIAERVLSEILAGKYSGSGKIPSVRELASLAGVNPNTVQNAMTLLEEKGAIHTLTGEGRFVTDSEDTLLRLRKETASASAKKYAEAVLALSLSDEEAKDVFLKELTKLKEAHNDTTSD